jgi:hypothetical protein
MSARYYTGTLDESESEGAAARVWQHTCELS